MSKPRVLAFVCQGKDCRRVWQQHHVHPGKWLKWIGSQLPLKLRVVESECMDHCEDAACICLVSGKHACLDLNVQPRKDDERVLETLQRLIDWS